MMRLTEWPHTYINLGIGLAIAVLGAVLWVQLARHIPIRLARAWGEQIDIENVWVWRGGKWLDALLVLLWCAACLLVTQHLGLDKFALAALVLSGGLLTLARIDVQTGLLPDALTLPWMWMGLLFHASGGWISPPVSLLGAAGGYCVLWLVFTAYKWKTGREGMGYGDFKLTAALGAWLGVYAIPSLLLYASVAGVLAGLVVKRLVHGSPHIAIPFGPFLALAGILILFRDYVLS